MQPTHLASQEKIYTVSRLNNEVKLLLEDVFPFVWVEGEISNFAAPQSGHWYFSLKDTTAQVRCAMFKGNQRRIEFTPKNGMHVLIKAHISLYESRGEFQLIAESMEERGEGKLKAAFEALKEKLKAAGLFEAANKKKLPSFPTQIGIITSATGAAIRDILTVLKRRYPCAAVIIYPTLVQGEMAAPAIVNAIQLANKRQECQLLVLARGGGSLEDLWPFNEEIVARAIYDSHLPLISGVGHEIDFTIADFVADQRAPTPSAAAEMAVPDRNELLPVLLRLHQQLQRQMRHLLNTRIQQLSWMQKHLHQQHPKRKLREKSQQLDFWEMTLAQIQRRLLVKFNTQLNTLDRALHQQTPLRNIESHKQQLHYFQQKLQNLITIYLNHQHNKLAQAAATLDAFNPLATLKRGYAIVTDSKHQIVRDAHTIQSGEILHVQLMQGVLACIVQTIKV